MKPIFRLSAAGRFFFAALAAAALLGASDTIPPPKSGLGSNHNYYLYNGGKPIRGLTVTVEITNEVVCDDIGFHIQLNANSPLDKQTNWQQYVMGFNPVYQEKGKREPVVGASIEYFSKPDDFNTSHMKNIAHVRGLPNSHTLPAGSKFIIALEYDGDDISGAKFTYVERDGRDRHSWTIPVPPPGISERVRTPIIAFQVDLVGKSSGDRAETKRGEGTITYASSEPMTVVNKKPPSKGQLTAETANSTYSELPAGPSTSFTQQFHFGADH